MSQLLAPPSYCGNSIYFSNLINKKQTYIFFYQTARTKSSNTKKVYTNYLIERLQQLVLYFTIIYFGNLFLKTQKICVVQIFFFLDS